MADFAQMQAEVTRIQGVVPSAVALINGIAARLDAAVNEAVAANDDADLTAITELSTALKSEGTALADAVAANSPPA